MDQDFYDGELATLKKLDHPNILQLHEVFDDKDNYYMVCEYTKGGELFDHITKKRLFQEHEVAEIIL